MSSTDAVSAAADCVEHDMPASPIPLRTPIPMPRPLPARDAVDSGKRELLLLF